MKKYMLFVLQNDYFNYWNGKHIEAENPEDLVKDHDGVGDIFMVGEVDLNYVSNAYEVTQLYGPYKRVQKDKVDGLEIKEVLV